MITNLVIACMYIVAVFGGWFFTHWLLRRTWSDDRELADARALPGYSPVLPIVFGMLAGVLGTIWLIGTTKDFLALFQATEQLASAIAMSVSTFLLLIFVSEVATLVWFFRRLYLPRHFHVLA